ncbi:hypothetical protein [Streptomyces sp. NPDC088261]|uniref:hypothetical protein n=1 Tax=Streptomyces sp. NPDC088261 TaxID=3365851 RepID=UPI0037F4E49B
MPRSYEEQGLIVAGLSARITWLTRDRDALAECVAEVRGKAAPTTGAASAVPA